MVSAGRENLQVNVAVVNAVLGPELLQPWISAGRYFKSKSTHKRDNPVIQNQELILVRMMQTQAKN